MPTSQTGRLIQDTVRNLPPPLSTSIHPSAVSFMMSPSLKDSAFTVREHYFEGQHIRQFPAATVEDEYPVKLHAKQYIPKWNTDPQPGDATLVCAHANGFWKELYEPLRHDLLMELTYRGVRIRAIWMPDYSTQGESGVLNEPHLGHDMAYSDHARDMLAMINHFRQDMPRPLIGIGHSMGGTQMVNLATMHPRLLEGIALVDPSIEATSKLMSPRALAKTTNLRLGSPDIWNSPEAAVKDLKKSPMMQGWDPRAERLFFESALRQTPTVLYPNTTGKWTLKTSKHSGIFAELRINSEGHGLDGSVSSPEGRSARADLNPDDSFITPFYNSAVSNAFKQLKHLRPPVFFVCGSESALRDEKNLQRMRERTGSGVGGSGGVALGQVETTTIKSGHLIPMTHPRELAGKLAAWLEPRLRNSKRRMTSGKGGRPGRPTMTATPFPKNVRS